MGLARISWHASPQSSRLRRLSISRLPLSRLPHPSSILRLVLDQTKDQQLDFIYEHGEIGGLGSLIVDAWEEQWEGNFARSDL